MCLIINFLIFSKEDFFFFFFFFFFLQNHDDLQRNGLDKQDQQIQKPISQVRIDDSKSRIIKETKITNNHVLIAFHLEGC
jgi:hypothetical protein